VSINRKVDGRAIPSRARWSRRRGRGAPAPQRVWHRGSAWGYTGRGSSYRESASWAEGLSRGQGRLPSLREAGTACRSRGRKVSGLTVPPLSSFSRANSIFLKASAICAKMARASSNAASSACFQAQAAHLRQFSIRSRMSTSVGSSTIGGAPNETATARCSRRFPRNLPRSICTRTVPGPSPSALRLRLASSMLWASAQRRQIAGTRLTRTAPYLVCRRQPGAKEEKPL
jgi:hypothetical protein